MAQIVTENLSNLDFDIDVDELTEDDPRSTNPPGIDIILKPHQQTLLARCVQYENSTIKLKQFNELSPYVDERDYFKTSMGILGDRVGSGKSYVILSLILSNDITQKNNIIIKSHGFNKVMYYIHDKATSIKTNLLVVPHNLAAQWEYYIKTFGGGLKYKVLKTQKAFDSLIKEALHPNDTNDEEETSTPRQQLKPTDIIGSYDLLVVTSTLYNKVAHFFYTHKMKLQRAIYDEVDNLNVPGCKHIDANFFWFVTASYGNVLYPKGQNKYEPSIGRYVWYANGIKHSGFLKNILMDLYYNISRNLMKVLVVKNKESYVESSLSLPEMVSHYVQCKTPYTINILNGVVDRNILNYLNADDIQGALQYVNPSHKSNESNIISRVIDKYTRQISNLNLQINTARAYLYDTEIERQDAIQRLEKQLVTVTKKIDTITERIKTNDLCTICYENAEKKTLTGCCQNTFCFKCINLWLLQSKLCPLCKINMNIDDLYVIDNDIQDTVEDTQENEIIEVVDMSKPNPKNDKYQNMELILQSLKSGAKLLIFSAYENSFTNVIPILNKLNIQFDYLKGNGYQIQATIERYKNGAVKVLLVNTRQYGSGLNLENTTDVILFHKFDTEIEKQVIGRAQRFGRKEPLHVHYLLYENEMPNTNQQA
jgi:SNF2 family DNA or RNA helicase